MKILVLGSGMMAHGAVNDLIKSKDVTTIGIGLRNKKPFLKNKKIKYEFLDVSKNITKIMKKYDTTISCVPYNFNYSLAQQAIKAKCNFIDLGGNNTLVNKELKLNKQAKKAGVTIIPDCGLAPGLVNLLSALVLRDLGGKADEIKIRVGGLPQKPEPPLNYAIVFSVHGLINEYKEKSIILKNHKLIKVDSLTEIEEFTFPKFPKLEAFHTSGGASTLVKTLRRNVKNLNYKTIRYKGHAQIMKSFMDMNLFNEPHRTQFEYLLAQTIPKNKKDLILVKIEGKRAGKKITYLIEDYQKGKITSMMRMTAYPASIIAQLASKGKIEKGAHPQELVIPLDEFFKEFKKRDVKIQKR